MNQRNPQVLCPRGLSVGCGRSVLCFFLSVVAVGMSSARANLVVYYSFEAPDDTADNLASDQSIHGYHGSLASIDAGSFSYVADAPAALAGTQSLLLSETSSNAASSFNAASLKRTYSALEFNPNASWTISTWFKRDAASTDEDFIFHLGNGDGFGGGDELYLYGSGADSLILHNYAANAQNVAISATGVDRDTWHHAAVVFDAVGGIMNLYLNGILAGTDASFVLNNLSQSSPVVFGGHTSSSFQTTRYFDGNLDDLALFDVPLSDTDVGFLASGGSPLDITTVPEPTSALLLLLGLAVLRCGLARCGSAYGDSGRRTSTVRAGFFSFRAF